MTAPKEPVNNGPEHATYAANAPAGQPDSNAPPTASQSMSGVDAAAAPGFRTGSDADAAQSDGAADPLAELQARLDAALAEVAQEREAVLRARAETENVRRRAQDDVSKAHKFGIESFAEALVPVKDSLEQALAQPEQTLDTLREGVELTLKQLTAAFERGRLLDIAPAQGDKFDPHRHQAISSIPSDQPANTVITTLQKGYLISDRVLRPALVTVAAG